MAGITGLAQWPEKTIPVEYPSSALTESQKRDLTTLVDSFPLIFTQAQADWAKFKTGVDAGLFTYSQKQTIGAWFTDFPRLWQTIRPNWEYLPSGMVSTHRAAFKETVDAWISKLAGSSPVAGGLGIAPLLIAGLLIAAAFGIGGAIWAVGYVKKQANITKLIDGVVAGKLPVDVLKDAIDKEQSSGLFGDIKGVLIAGAVLFGLLTFGPALKGMLPEKEKA
jgi:hypothetical protein